jgi:hypothetical protein
VLRYLDKFGFPPKEVEDKRKKLRQEIADYQRAIRGEDPSTFAVKQELQFQSRAPVPAADNNIEDRRHRLARVDEEARRCGFHMLGEGTDADRGGFHQEWKWPRYEFTQVTSVNAVKVDILLIRACLDGGRIRSVAPCNDALDIISRRGSDPKFMATVDLNFIGAESLRGCFGHLKHGLVSEPTRDSLARLAQQWFAASWKEREWRPQPSIKEPQSGSSRVPVRSAPSYGDDRCFWSPGIQMQACDVQK